MPRKRRRAKRRSAATVQRLERLVAAGEPWRGPVPGVSISPHLTELLTGHDFFGNGFGDDAARDLMWGVLRDGVLKMCTELEAPAPWAHRHYDLEEKLPPPETLELAGSTYWFDERAVDRILTFSRAYMMHVEGPLAGQPFEPLEWQIDVLSQLYGWKRPDGTRRFREAYVEIPKKNGKSYLTSCLNLYHLLADGELRPKVFGLAADRENARIVYDAAKAIVESSEALQRVCKVYEGRLEGLRNGGKYRVMSAEAYTKHGVNASAWVFDELHAQPGPELWDVMDGAGAARAQPLRISLTTAGYDRNSICWEQRKRARAAQESPELAPGLLPVIYTAATEDGKGGMRPPEDWDRESAWRRANPSIGITPSVDFFEDQVRKAKQSHRYKAVFLRLHLNVWTQQAVRLIPLEQWDKCDERFDPADYPCIGSGLDLAHTRDLSAWARLYRLEHDVIGLRLIYWIPEDDIEKRTRRDKVSYQLWAESGRVQVTRGNVTDFDQIREYIVAETQSGPGSWIAYDRRFASQLVTQLMDASVDMVPYGQTFADMALPTAELLRRVQSGKLAHGGDPVLRWMAGNAAGIQNDDGHIRISKARSGEKIDGLVAVAMALGWWMRQPAPKKSVYEERGFREIDLG